MFCLIALLGVIISVAAGQECVQGENCHLPDCFCPTYSHPLGAKNIPQIVYFGFDDAVQPQVSAFYNQIFTQDRKNPNGCPITMSLYISDEYTVYSLVEHFFKRGDETGDHSVTHTDIDTAEKLREEASKQRDNIKTEAGVPAKDVIGWRSPNLKTAGDDQPRVLKELNFTYDISITYDRDTNYPFPFTLDFGYPYPCPMLSCPTSKHPGFWEVTVHSLIDPVSGLKCAYVDSCRPAGEDAALEYLWSNFLMTYENERAPFGLNMHAAWFEFPGTLDATIRFIERLLSKTDVYIISVKQMMEWMKNPVNITQIKDFEPWGCGNTAPPTIVRPTTRSRYATAPKRGSKPDETKTTTPTSKPAVPIKGLTERPSNHFYHNNVNLQNNPKPIFNWYQNHRTSSVITTTTTRAPVLRHTTPRMKNDNTFLWQSYKAGSDTQQRATESRCLKGVNCKMPHCFCKTSSPPMSLSTNDVPQMIYLAIDSQIDGRTFSSLMQLFSGSLRNPNGCPISGTVFIQPTGNYPPYVRVLRQNGVQISSRSRRYMSRQFARMTLTQDISRNKDLLSPNLGWRSPGFLPSSDIVLKTLQELNAVFDSSVIDNGTDLTWPYTLDFGIQNVCSNSSSLCPRYRGMWEVPLQPLIIPGITQTCLYLDFCPTQIPIEQLLMYNFNRHLNNGKIPFGINLSNEWLSYSGRNGLRQLFSFLERVLQTKDVIVVSIDTMLQWMKSPGKNILDFNAC